jgi:hypothetical protein
MEPPKTSHIYSKLKHLPKNGNLAPLIARDLANAELVGDLDIMLKTFLRIAHGEDIKLEPSPIYTTGLLERALKYVCKDVCHNESIRCYLNN